MSIKPKVGAASRLTPPKEEAVDLMVITLGSNGRLFYEAQLIAQTARARAFKTTVLALDSLHPLATWRSKLLGHVPRLVLLGGDDSGVKDCLHLSRWWLEQQVGPAVLFGPAFALVSDRLALPQAEISGVIVGDAAQAATDLLQLPRPSELSRVRGVDCLDGSYLPRAPRPLDSSPFPQMDCLDLAPFRSLGLPLRLSRGCPRRCMFCSKQPREGVFRTREAASVFEEMQFHVAQSGVRRFQFVDLVLNGDLMLLDQLAELLLRRNLNVSWWGRALIDPQMPPALYRKIRRAGCIGLELEVISGADAVLSSMRAEHTADQAASATARSWAAGINTGASFLVGLPDEAEEQFWQTAAWLRANRHFLSRVVHLQPCQIDPGSLLYKEHVARGICIAAENPREGWHDGGFNTPAHRRKWAKELRVFIEEYLWLDVVGDGPLPSWDPPTRQQISRRILSRAEQAEVKSDRYAQTHRALTAVLKKSPALAGPEILEIDLTNNCNQRCVGCWTHSLLMKERRLTGTKRRATLDFDRLAQLIRDAKRMGTRQIQLSGAGEPFLHPRIDELIELIKDEELRLDIITNFTLVDQRRAHRLVDLAVDHLTVSLWAGTPETYRRTHPQAKSSQFARVKEVLGELSAYRQKTGSPLPKIKIYHVISHFNCHEIHAMIDTALEVGADLIEFTPVDIVPGYSDALALTPEDKNSLQDQLLTLRRHPDYLQRTWSEVTEGRLPGLEEQGEFARFLKRRALPADFHFALEDIRWFRTRCRRGLEYSYNRGVESGQRSDRLHQDSALVLPRDADDCRPCTALAECSVDPFTYSVQAPFLSLQGLGSFWRRISESGGEKAKVSDSQVVDRIPCSIGYTYARVQATGHVIPCCKAARFPLGNILATSFDQIWHSAAYEEFRRKALTLAKSDPYFDTMECTKVCDNLGHNMNTADRLKKLSPAARERLLRGGGAS